MSKHTEIEDAKQFLQQEFGDDYKSLRAYTNSIADGFFDDADAAHDQLLIKCAQMKLGEKIAAHPKDFVPYTTPDGDKVNEATAWPPIPIFKRGPKFDPFGLRQNSLAKKTIEERNQTICCIYKLLQTNEPFYTAEAPYYPWLITHFDAVVNICKQADTGCEPCGLPLGECECRDFPKRTSFIKLLCRALGREDLWAKYNTALQSHADVTFVERPARARKQKPQTVLPLDVQQKIKEFAEQQRVLALQAMAEIPVALLEHGFANYETLDTPEHEEMMDDEFPNDMAYSQKDLRYRIKRIFEPATNYIILSDHGYTKEKRPTRGDLPAIRFWSPTLDSQTAYMKVTEDVCVLKIPNTTKMGRELVNDTLTGTNYHQFLLRFFPYAKALQKMSLEQGDGLTDSPFLVCSFNHTKCYIHETEKSPSKTLIGSAWTGLTNYRARMFKNAGIEISSGSNGVIAARRCSQTNDALANQRLSPKSRAAAKKRQCAERDHSVLTAEAVYEGQYVNPPAPAPKRKKKSTNEPSDYQPIECQSEVDLDQCHLTTRKKPPAPDATPDDTLVMPDSDDEEFAVPQTPHESTATD